MCIQNFSSVCTFECVCRTEVNLRCCSSGAVHLILRVSPHRLKRMVSVRHGPPASSSLTPALHVIITTRGFLSGMEHRNSCLHGVYFTIILFLIRVYAVPVITPSSSRMCTDSTPHSVFYRQRRNALQVPTKGSGERWCCPGPSLKIMKFALQQET